MNDAEASFRLIDADGWTVGRFAAIETGAAAHAVTTRRGPDCAMTRADPGWAAMRLAHWLGLGQAAWLDQVHGNVVLAVRLAGLAGRADGLVTAQTGLALVGRSADCPLILLADEDAGVVGMAHASWRGTVARIAANLVEAAVQLGAKRDRMIACICPSAGQCCYEVGRDVLRAALDGIGQEARRFFAPRDASGEKLMLDLWGANRRQLEQAGLRQEGIHVAGVCTLCRNDIFPSHRREGDAAGRFMAAIAMRRAIKAEPPSS